MRDLLAVSFAVLATGCLTVGASQPASTLGKGNVTGGVESQFWGVVTPRSGLGWLPSGSGFIRFGVHDHVDLGARVGLNGFELQGKFMLTPPESPIVFSLIVTPQGAYVPGLRDMAGNTSPNFGRLAFPVGGLFGIKLGDHELVFGAREVNDLYFLKENFAGAPTTQVLFVGLGASAGIALRLGNGFILMPEFAIQAPLWASVSSQFGTGSAFTTPGVQFTAGVTCIFGKMRPRRDSAPPPPAEEQPLPPPGDGRPYSPPPLPPDVAPVPPPPPPPPTDT